VVVVLVVVVVGVVVVVEVVENRVIVDVSDSVLISVI
jgi:hypothetical protein